jgi:hypothetical protein
MGFAKRILCIVAPATIAACATTGGAQDTIAVVGRVDETFDAAADAPSSPGVYRPGMGGAIGDAVAGVLMRSGKEPAHTIYVVKLADETKRYVRQRERLAVGVCVSVVTEKAKIAQESWKYGEASLRLSKECS